MAFRRRRKPRVLWLPTFGRDFSEGEGANPVAGVGGTLTVASNGEIETDVTPLTYDYSDSSSQEQATQFRSLQDLTQGNAYRLRRIVGKFHASCIPQDNSLSVYAPLEVAAGFIINRTDSDGNILIEATTISGDVTRGPLAQDSMEDPWIWRRKWILSPIQPNFVLGDIQQLATLNNFQGYFPNTTAGYGSVLDGPHIDQKTARVISNEERLFFWIQARHLATVVTPAIANANTLNWSLDYRLLASLRQNIGNRRNATR